MCDECGLFRRAATGAFRHPADGRFVPFRQLPRALRQWVALQDEFEAFYFIADQHAITVPFDPRCCAGASGARRRSCWRSGSTRSARRSSCRARCPSTAQLAWVLGCLTGYGEASRMTQFKDKSARGELGGGDRRAVHVSDPAGRRHPALPGRLGAGGRGPAPASGADPRSREAVQRPLRQGLQSARALHPEGHGEGARPRQPRQADEQVGGQPGRSAEPAGGARPACARRSSSAVTDSGREVVFDPVGKPGVTNLLTIGGALTGRQRRAVRRRLRGPRLRRSEEGRRRDRRRFRHRGAGAYRGVARGRPAR